MKLFDLVRIIGIAFDNAIEESEQLANVQAINDQYDNMFIEYSEKDNCFNFTMVID